MDVSRVANSNLTAFTERPMAGGGSVFMIVVGVVNSTLHMLRVVV